MSAPEDRLVELRVPVHSSHPAFIGHFPGDPIFPGVALLGLVVSALQERLGDDLWVTAIPSVRWRAVVQPGAVLDVRLSRLAKDHLVGFEVWRDEALVSHGTLVVARAER